MTESHISQNIDLKHILQLELCHKIFIEFKFKNPKQFKPVKSIIRAFKNLNKPKI